MLALSINDQQQSDYLYFSDLKTKTVWNSSILTTIFPLQIDCTASHLLQTHGGWTYKFAILNINIFSLQMISHSSCLPMPVLFLRVCACVFCAHVADSPFPIISPGLSSSYSVSLTGCGRFCVRLWCHLLVSFAMSSVHYCHMHWAACLNKKGMPYSPATLMTARECRQTSGLLRQVSQVETLQPSCNQ